MKAFANWLKPVDLKVVSGAAGGEYDVLQRGYKLQAIGSEPISVQIQGAADGLIANMVLIIEDFSNPDVQVKLNGKKLPAEAFRYGVEKSWLSDTAVVWFSGDMPANSIIEVK